MTDGTKWLPAFVVLLAFVVSWWFGMLLATPRVRVWLRKRLQPAKWEAEQEAERQAVERWTHEQMERERKQAADRESAHARREEQRRALERDAKARKEREAQEVAAHVARVELETREMLAFAPPGARFSYLGQTYVAVLVCEMPEGVALHADVLGPDGLGYMHFGHSHLPALKAEQARQLIVDQTKTEWSDPPPLWDVPT